MFNAVKPLGELLKLKQINTSDAFFVLNTKLTTAMLVLFSVLLSTKELFGKSIDCYSESDSNKEIMNDYCWTNGTFIHAESIDGSSFFFIFLKLSYFFRFQEITVSTCAFSGTHGKHIVNYGISPYSPRNRIIFQRYYQWMVMVLIGQALVCYLPAYLWKLFEGGFLQDLCKGLGEFAWEKNIRLEAHDNICRFLHRIDDWARWLATTKEESYHLFQ